VVGSVINRGVKQQDFSSLRSDNAPLFIVGSIVPVSWLENVYIDDISCGRKSVYGLP